jgi:predicted amidohydrolase
MRHSLKLAFLHLAVKHEDTAANRALILDKLTEAAALGADVVLAPEMATSGYAFDDSSHAAKHAETIDGVFVADLARRCAKAGCWACVGMPIKEAGSDRVHNSALLIDSKGEIRIEYHKVMAERAWAAQGSCDPSGVVDTPWGKVGVLICSDTYYGLLPRLRKLQGADLLLIPANWPPSSLDPKRLWSVHARLNGMYLAVCNRTGMDRTLDCTSAVSYCIAPNGKTLLEGRCHESAVFSTSIPLINGKIDTPSAESVHRETPPVELCMNQSRGMLPEHHKIHVYACAGVQCRRKDTWNQATSPVTADGSGNTVLVCYGCRAENEMPVGCRATFNSQRIVRVSECANMSCTIDALPYLPDTHSAPRHATAPWVHKIDGIRIGVVTHETAQCPESMFALAESNCDVCVVIGDGAEHPDDISYNCVHRMVIVHRTHGKARIAIPPDGHETWREESAAKDGICRAVVAYDVVRNKEWLKRVSCAKAAWAVPANS